MTSVLQPDAGYDWVCQRCGHQWRSRVPNPPAPAQCSKCRSAYWNRPKQGKQAKARRIPVATGVATPGHSLLLPPPHLRNQPYHPPDPEPMPENAIQRSNDDDVVDWNSNGNDNGKTDTTEE